MRCVVSWELRSERVYAGPWVCGDGPDGYQHRLTDIHTTGRAVCDVLLSEDARLISAAPDMLAALQAVLNDCDDLDMVESNEVGRDVGPFGLVYAAIAKATGAQP